MPDKNASKGSKPAAAKANKATKAKKAPAAPPDPLQKVASQPFLDAQLHGVTTKAPVSGMKATAATGGTSLSNTGARLKKAAPVPVSTLPVEIKQSMVARQAPTGPVHGSKFSLAMFSHTALRSGTVDTFGYLSSAATRTNTRLAFTAANRALVERLGEAMAAPGRDDALPDSPIHAGLTYVGQFVDHDITFDVSSSLDVATDATTVHNMRTPVLDLDSLYGRGPVLDPYLYAMPGVGSNPTAIKLQLGTNTDVGPGGPGGPAGFGGMVTHSDRDVRGQSAKTTPPSSAIHATTRT